MSSLILKKDAELVFFFFGAQVNGCYYAKLAYVIFPDTSAKCA